MKTDILHGKKVLVAEDNVINQMVVKHTLLKLGATADIVNDGAEALERFKNNNYDLVLMDIQMPIIDGYDATAFIRSQLKCQVPIIAMTAFAQNGEEEKCYEKGMNGYVSKPFTIEGLSTAIQKALAQSPETEVNPYILGNNHVLVDVSMLYEISGDDEEYIGMMVQTFLEVMPKTLKTLQSGIQEANWESVYRTAHFAKSSLSIIKINQIFNWVLKIEQFAKSRTNTNEIEGLYKQICEKYAFASKLLAEKFQL